MVSKELFLEKNVLRYLFPQYTQWTVLNFIVHVMVGGLLVFGGVTILQLCLFLAKGDDGHYIIAAVFLFAYASMVLGSLLAMLREGFMALGGFIEERPWGRHLVKCVCAMLALILLFAFFLATLPPDLP